MKLSRTGVVFFNVASLMWASSAHASQVVFPMTSTAAFGDYQPVASASNIVYSPGKGIFADQTEFTWGGRSNTSKLAFDGLAFDADLNAFNLGSLYYNNATFLADLAISSVKLDIKLSFAGNNEKIISYDIGIDDTLNSGPGCTLNGCPDVITIAPTSGEGKFLLATVDSNQYFFEFLGFDTAGNLNSYKFETAEDSNSTAQLYGRITTSAVPLPAAVWPFLSSSLLIGSLAWPRRRQK